MATGLRKGHGIKDRAISDSAGVRPFKLDCAFANAAGTHAEFLAAKSASGLNLASAEEGDFYFDSTNNVFTYYTGAAWANMSGGTGSALAIGSTWIGAAGGAAALDLKGSGKIPVGNGTTATSVSVSGDISLSSAGLALLSDKYGERTVTSLATAGAGTYTAAHLLGGVIVRDCAGASRTDTTSTAALLVTALGVAAEVGSFVECIVVNDSDAEEVITLAGGAGCTLDVSSGAGGATGTLTDATVKRGEFARLLFVFSNVTAAAEACAVYCVGRGRNTPIALGTAGQVYQMNAAATSPEWGTRYPGIIQLPISSARELAASATQNLAAHGGILASDSTPILNVVTAGKEFGLAWAAGNNDEIMWQVAIPPDFNEAVAAELHCMAKCGDGTALAAQVFFRENGTDAGGNTGNMAAGIAEVSVAFNAGNQAAHPGSLSVSLAPANHVGATAYVTAAWIEYTRKGV